MSDLKQAEKTQLQNIQESTGKDLEAFTVIVKESGLEKHNQILKMLKEEYGLTHGNANLIALKTREAISQPSNSEADLLTNLFPEKKIHLKPIYDELASIASALGKDVEIIPQKTAISFRTKKMFATVNIPNMKSIKLGLKLKDIQSTERLTEVSGMCSHQVVISDPDDVDDEISNLLVLAYKQSLS